MFSIKPYFKHSLVQKLQQRRKNVWLLPAEGLEVGELGPALVLGGGVPGGGRVPDAGADVHGHAGRGRLGADGLEHGRPARACGTQHPPRSGRPGLRAPQHPTPPRGQDGQSAHQIAARSCPSHPQPAGKPALGNTNTIRGREAAMPKNAVRNSFLLSAQLQGAQLPIRSCVARLPPISTTNHSFLATTGQELIHG